MLAAREVKKAVNILRAFTDEASMLTMLAGKTSLSNLEHEDLRALTLDASKITGSGSLVSKT